MLLLSVYVCVCVCQCVCQYLRWLSFAVCSGVAAPISPIPSRVLVSCVCVCVCVCVCGFRVLGFVVLGFWGFRFFLIVAAARHVTTKIQQRNKKKPNKQKQNQRNNRLQKIVAPGTKIHSVFFSVHYDMLNE